MEAKSRPKIGQERQKNEKKGPRDIDGGCRGVYFWPRVPEKDQRSLKKAAMLAADC